MKELCDFEGGDTCGWRSLDPSLVPIHAFRWSPDQGETIHDGEQYHRPVNDHTLWVPIQLIILLIIFRATENIKPHAQYFVKKEWQTTRALWH